MPFASKMDSRRQLAHRVLVEGWPVARAALSAGVSRETAYTWLERARDVGIDRMAEISRRPHRSPGATSEELVAELLELKARYPMFGPKKLSALMEGRIEQRTAGRILKRHGLTCAAFPGLPEAHSRFERAYPNELWQMDFKGLKRRPPRYEVLSIVDDATRRLIALRALANQQLETFWPVLWEAFGEYGLPDSILTDNGASFRCFATWRLSRMDALFIRLGIRPAHGRPYHPQTQGKVERLHGTLQRDLRGALIQPSIDDLQPILDEYRNLYDWIRPHEAIGQRPPGTIYTPSKRSRPSQIPEVTYELGMAVRKVCKGGFFKFKGETYRAGMGLVGEAVGVRREEIDGELAVYFGTYRLGNLQEFLR